MSDGRPTGPSGVALAAATASGLAASSARPIGVRVGPGDTDTTRAPRLAHSTAVRSTSRSIPRLEAP